MNGFDKKSKRVHIQYEGGLETEWLWPTEDRVVFEELVEDEEDLNVDSECPVPPKFKETYYQQMEMVSFHVLKTFFGFLCFRNS